MRNAFYIALAACVWAFPATLCAQGPGGLNSGGGIRSGNGIQAVDALGSAVAGDAVSEGIQAASGFISGLPIVTPVALRVFHVELTAKGVTVRWEGVEGGRLTSFFLERAQAEGEDAPGDEDYVRYDMRFSGPGPHQFVDDQVEVGKTYYYRLGWISDSRTRVTVGPWSVYIDPSAEIKPAEIYAAHPNPFREAFVISMFLSEPASLGWSIHDLQGRVVAQGGTGHVPSGFHSHRVSPYRPLSGGVYFLRVTVGKQEHVQKIIALP